jgi:hypothetical protein
MGDEQDQGPDEIELLFDGQGPEVIERQGRRILERAHGQIGKVLQEEDEDGQRLELREGCAAGDGCDRGGEQGEHVQRKDPERSANVEVAQAMALTEGVPEAAGDEKTGEGEEENDAQPADLGSETDEAHGGRCGLEAPAIVEEEDHEDGEAAEAVEGGVAAGFGNGCGRERRIVVGRFDEGSAGGCVGSHWAQPSELEAGRQLAGWNVIFSWG